MTKRLRSTPPIRLVPILLLVESALYSGISPILPHYQRSLHASKPAIGVLAAAYAAGLIPGAMLGGWLAARTGVRRTTLAGLLAFAAAAAPFGFLSTIAGLDVLRALQGAAAGCIWGGALTWMIAASARERRGQVIGAAIAAATIGTLLGPALGTFAVAAGTAVAFATVAAAALALSAWVALQPEPPAPPEPAERTPVRRLARSREFVLGTWLVVLDAGALGAVFTLVPLRMARFGAPGIAIGAAFLCASGVSALLAPRVGRITDRRGPFVPMRAGLLGSAVLILGLGLPRTPLLVAAAMIVLAVPLTGYLTPAATLITDAAERHGIALVVATMTLNLAYALGETVGAPAGASLSQATSDELVFVLIAVIMAATLIFARAVAARSSVRPPAAGSSDAPRIAA